MDVFEQLETIKYFIKEEIKRLEDLLLPIDCILSQLKESKLEYTGLSTGINALATSCKAVDEANGFLIKNVNKISTLLKPKIQWHSNKKEMLEMFYLDGNSPWSVWLTYNPSTEIDSLYRILEERYSKGLLKKLHNPKVGDFICCYDKKILFRAVIIEVCNTRIKVINVDRYNVKIIKLDACFEITRDLSGIHAYSIQCCLTKDKKFENKWNEDLGRLLQNTLRECRLTVRIVEEVQALPPLFVVEMYAFNEALEVETNISEWIALRLLPELKNLPFGHDHVLDYFSDEALDPFFIVSNVSQSSSVPSSSEHIKDLSPKAPADVSRSMKNIPLEENVPKEKPKNRLAHLMNVDMTGNSGTNISLKSDNNSFVPDKLSPTLNISNIYSTSGMVPFGTVENVITHADPSADNKTNEVYNVMLNGFHEDSVIPGNYIPTDDDRICAFFIKKGFCWKPSCKKLHTKISRVSDKWTEDSAELFVDTLNSPNLPAIGSVITLKVTFVVFCNIFYALLPDNFSDTDEGCETAATLNKSLNSLEAKKEFKLLKTPPCLGQLLVAYSSEKSMWLRASIRDVLDNGILQVFFVDYGVTEELSLDKCREIEPQFVHLPCQAVYCTLANVFVESTMDNEGKLFMESLLLGQEIEVEIIDSDIINNRLEVIAFHNGVNINQLLMDQGYCLPFER